MAIHKKEEFTQKEQDLANFAKAMAPCPYCHTESAGTAK